MYLEGNGLRGTGRILGGSNATRLNWIKQFGENIKESVLGNLPHEIPDLEIVEIDERWHFTVKKNENYGSGSLLIGIPKKSLVSRLGVAERKPSKS